MIGLAKSNTSRDATKPSVIFVCFGLFPYQIVPHKVCCSVLLCTDELTFFRSASVFRARFARSMNKTTKYMLSQYLSQVCRYLKSWYINTNAETHLCLQQSLPSPTLTCVPEEWVANTSAKKGARVRFDPRLSKPINYWSFNYGLSLPLGLFCSLYQRENTLFSKRSEIYRLKNVWLRPVVDFSGSHVGVSGCEQFAITQRLCLPGRFFCHSNLPCNTVQMFPLLSCSHCSTRQRIVYLACPFHAS